MSHIVIIINVLFGESVSSYSFISPIHYLILSGRGEKACMHGMHREYNMGVACPSSVANGLAIASYLK